MDQAGMPDEAPSKPPLAITSKAFVGVEQVVSIAIGVFLTIAAVVALVGAATKLWSGLAHWDGPSIVFEVVDQLLFVLMLVEILHTVRRSIESHELACEPFLIVGLIATVRRILVVTLQSSDSGMKQVGPPPPPFSHTMIELGVLSALTLVLILSIYIARRSGGAAA
jgi:uncharacterized membrane protein (DUF373 family)